MVFCARNLDCSRWTSPLSFGHTVVPAVDFILGSEGLALDFDLEYLRVAAEVFLDVSNSTV